MAALGTPSTPWFGSAQPDWANLSGLLVAFLQLQGSFLAGTSTSSSVVFLGAFPAVTVLSKASELAQISRLSLGRKAEGGKSISQTEEPPGAVSVLTSGRLEVNSESASHML